MSQPSKSFLRPHVPRFPPWRRPGRLHRADPWERPEPGAPPCRCAHSPRSRPFEASFSASAQGRGPPRSQGSASGRLRVEQPVAPSGCALGWRLAFSGARTPGRDFAGSGQAAPRIPGRLLPWGSLSCRRQASFLGEVRGQCVRAAGSPGAAPRGGSGARPGSISCGKRGFPALPLGAASIQNRFRAPPWPGPGSTGLLHARAGLWVARRGKHAKTTGREPALFLGCAGLFSPLLRVNQKELEALRPSCKLKRVTGRLWLTITVLKLREIMHRSPFGDQVQEGK